VPGRTLGRDRPRVRPGGEVVAKQDINVSSRPKPQPETNHKEKLRLVNTQSLCAHSAPEGLFAGRDCTRRYREPPPICVYPRARRPTTITTEVEILRRQLSRRVSRLASVGVLRPRSFVQPCTSEDLSDEAGLRQVMCVSGSSNSPSCLVRAAMIFATTRRFSTQLGS